MERPETVRPEIWDRLDDEAKEFVSLHETMHGHMWRILGVSRADYWAVCTSVLKEEHENGLSQ